MRPIAAAFVLGLAIVAEAAPGDDDGRRMAATRCATCHGPTGISVTPDAPHLAGQPEAYLVEQLRRYRDGGRSHEVMGVIARALKDQEIALLAAWYSSMTIEVKAPK